MQLHVVSHTHWDREWYHGAGRFRQRLVRLVDELLDAPDGATRPPAFLLDGQAVVLEDYLRVRPGRRAELTAALACGRLEAGPWYVLADALIPSGESLVRNLQLGREVVSALGGKPPPVLYAPDSFGHPAALPRLARGFGMGMAIVWRGYGGDCWPQGDSAWWEAAGGERVLLHHLPPDGYEFGSNLPAGLVEAAARWRAMRSVLAPRARLGVVLLPNGADHHALQRDAAAAVRALESAAAPVDEVRWTSLGEFARAAAARADSAALPTVRGELRDSSGYTWSLQGTFATRAAQKRHAARAERLLLRSVEPWLALSGAASEASVSALLREAWRTLLLCHPHDTLCGCSTDEVARAMDARLESARSQGRGLREIAIHALTGHDAEAARVNPDCWRPLLVVRNEAPRARGGVCELSLLSFVRHVPVGPRPAAEIARGHPALDVPSTAVVDGGRVMVQALRTRLAYDLVESPRHYPRCDLVRRTRALAWLPPLPGYGVRQYPLDTGPAEVGEPAGPRLPASAGERWLDNGRIRVEVGADGRVAVRTPAGRWIPELLAFEDVGDVGDCYTHSPSGSQALLRATPTVRLVRDGPLRASLSLHYDFQLPARRRRRRRASRLVACPVRVTLSVDAESDILRVRVRGHNRARDHRLRIVLRTGIANPRQVADAAFGPVQRHAVPPAHGDTVAERPPATAPLHRHLTLAGGGAGVAVLSDGLAEYEASAAGEVAVTLIRAVGALSRANLPERPGHAGWPRATPAAQSLGRFTAHLGLLFLDSWTDESPALVEEAADDFLLPLVGTTRRSAIDPPGEFGGAELMGVGLAFGAMKPASDDEWRLVLRCVNVLDRAVAGCWRLYTRPERAAFARLDESVEAPLEVAADGSLRFTVAPRGVVTILVR